MKVLLIEDDPSLIWVIQTFIKLEGGEVELICADTINDALQALDQGCPDLVLIDLILRGEFAQPVLNKLQAMKCKSVVMSAAHKLAELVAQEYNMDLLSKPFELEELEKLLV